MSITEIKTILEQIHVAKFSLKSYLKNRFPEVYHEIFALTQFLGDDESISIHERIYCIFNNITSRPLCCVCNKNSVKFDAIKNHYKKWCSISCSCKDPETLQKSKKTRLEKYGNSTYNGIEKSRATRFQQNNGSWHSADFKAKSKKTKLEHYGNENFVNSEKCAQTKLERYGSATYVNTEKIKLTKLERYGDAAWNNSTKIRKSLNSRTIEEKTTTNKKRKQTNLEKYGHESPTQNENIKSQIKSTCLERYNSTSSLTLPHVRTKLREQRKLFSWDHFISQETEYLPLFTKDEYIHNTDPHKKWKWQHRRCGKIFESEYDDVHHHRCYDCWPNTNCGTSLLEQEIRDYVKSLLPESVVFNKQPENHRIIDRREIDIYIPAKHIGIEVDGLYYHSVSSGKDRHYHLDKTLACEKQGIQLIHIFEDEWLQKTDIVKSRLRHILTQNHAKRIFARKCEIHEISNLLKDEFLCKYHLQGKDVSKIRYGMFFENKLVAVMTFVKSRFNKHYEWELSRYATIDEYTVVGGASRLLARFEQEHHPKSLITYADRRWSIGNVYQKLGFSMTESSAPAYWYIKNGNRYSRVMFQKHRLKDKLEFFDENLSEVENMAKNGYDRIFDCGNLVFVKEYS